MSIYGTVCSIDDPITYYGSHVHPYEDHPREVGRALAGSDREEADDV